MEKLIDILRADYDMDYESFVYKYGRSDVERLERSIEEHDDVKHLIDQFIVDHCEYTQKRRSNLRRGTL